MRRLFLITVLAIGSIVFLEIPAQSQYKKNDILLHFGGYSGLGYPTGVSNAMSNIPTLRLGGDYLLNKFFNIGAYVAYTYNYFEFDHPTSGYKDVWKGWDLGMRTELHIGSFFIKNENWDLYLASSLGYIDRSMIYDKSNIYRDFLNYTVKTLGVSASLGLRARLNKVVGAYGELGLSRQFFGGAGFYFIIRSKK